VLPSLSLPFGVVVPAHAVCLVAAIALGVWLGPRWAGRRIGVPPVRIRGALLALTVVELAGGRVHFVLNHWHTFADRPLAAFAVWHGGIHAGGAVLALVVAAPLVLAWFGVPAGRALDALVPSIGLGIAVARLGCLLHGCCFGIVTDAPWGVRFPADSLAYDLHGRSGLLPFTATESLPVHPLPLYFAAAGLAVAGLGWWLARRKRWDGEIVFAALLLFGATSAALETLRAELPGRVYWGSVPQIAAIALAIAAIGAAGLVAGEAARRTLVVTRSQRAS
jgi:phosphatidylglycerol:prolipoprotein diacylglycerol transferase